MRANNFLHGFGRGTPSTVPSWITSQTLNTWGSLPSDTLSDANPDPGFTAAWKGNSGQSAAVSKWNGGAFDSTNGVLWLTALGGHSDYYGNEVYKLDLNQASPAWDMVLSPSNLGSYSVASGTAAAYSDGRPRSTHSYNGCIYIPSLGPALAGLVATSPDGTDDGTGATVAFNTTTGAATFYSSRPYGGGGSTTGVAACFDATRGTNGSIWRRNQGTQAIQKWDVAADTWSNVGSVEAWAGSCCLAAHPGGAYLLVGNGDSDGGQTVSGGWCVFKCADGTYHTPTFSGTVSGGLEPGRCQPVWSATLGKFLAWDNDTDRTRITTFTPGADPFVDTWTVSYLTVSLGNTVTPSAAQAAGTYGRFFVWDAAGICGVINSNTEAGFFFRFA